MTRSLPASTPSAPTSLSRHWIFGYGSLVHVEDLGGFLAGHGRDLETYTYATLRGFRRSWSVAMDNTQTKSGYKYYLDIATGERPPYVAFANIEPDDAAHTHGILFEADEHMLEILDARERNYHRTDVTARVTADIDGTVWTYIGTAEAKKRYEHALRTNALVVDKVYVDLIASAFARARLDFSAEIPDGVALVELARFET